MQRYVQYTLQSSQWLGYLPLHWQKGRVSHVAEAYTSNVDKLSVDGQPAVRLCNYTDVYKNERIVDDMAFMPATATPEQVHRFRLRRGDVLITKDSETADDIGIPAYVDYEAGDLLCGYHLAIIRPNQEAIVPRLLYWIMASSPTLRQWGVVAAGVTRVGIRSGELTKVVIPLPPLEEQHPIADYLDRETERIDALIAKQELLVKKLRERRAAVVERVVTKGVDSNVATKPSGIRWAGEIPAHWQFGNIRRFARMKTRHTPSRSEPSYWERCTIPWFTLADVWQMRDERCTYVSAETDSAISEPGLKNSAAELLPADTVMLSRTASVGFAGIMPVPMATSQDYWNWICGSGLLPRYLLATFRAMTREIKALMIGSTHKTIYEHTAATMCIVVPPLDEQRCIVEYLDGQTGKIDTLIAKAERFIELARERRGALITAAVTGQIDVIGATA